MKSPGNDTFHNEVDGASCFLNILLDSDNTVTKQMQEKNEKKVIVTFAFAGVVKCSACVS